MGKDEIFYVLSASLKGRGFICVGDIAVKWGTVRIFAVKEDILQIWVYARRGSAHGTLHRSCSILTAAYARKRDLGHTCTDFHRSAHP
jgi:hypothetical protein